MNIYKYLVALSIAILLTGCTSVIETSDEPIQNIGGQRDVHGCLGPAGYSWNGEVGACIREWELDDDQKRAASIAMGHLGYKKGSTIIQVMTARCPGCFVVEVERDRDRIKVTLDNWVIKKQSLTPDQCIARGGRTVNTVGGAQCEENEENVGDVTGFISPNICCIELE